MGTSIPLWVPLVVAVIGLIATIVGTIAGVLITQRRSDRRDDKTWARELERERERAAREEAARTFELRRESYVEFYKAADASLIDCYGVFSQRRHPSRSGPPSPDRPTPQPSIELVIDQYSTLEQLRIYGSGTVIAHAEKLHESLEASRRDMTFENLQAARDALVELLTAIRSDLGIPGGAIEVQLPELPTE